MEKTVKIQMTSSLGIRPAGGGPAVLYGPGIVDVPESVARKIVAIQGAAPPLSDEDSQGYPLDPDARAKKLAETAKRDAKAADKEEAKAERDSDKALREAQAAAEKAQKEAEREAAKAAKEAEKETK